MSTPVNLEWKNLNLVIEKSEFNLFKCRRTTEQKRILDNVSGNLKSGQLVAILGSSGAGKTTLLASISQRFRGPLTGELLINGTQINRRTMTKISCFVPQFDISLDTLTPNEHMYFMGELKMDREWSRSRKNRRIEFLLHSLGLQHVANNRITTLSGGERKKLNLAADLLNNPPIIFCDEPTTGLDSFNARTVIKALKYLSESDQTDDSSSMDFVSGNNATMGDDGLELLPKTKASKAAPKAVICSIHQPTSEIFQCFSHIVLMYAGKCIFQGSAEEALTYFSSLGFQCPTSYNPADFYLDVLSNTKDNGTINGSRSFFKTPTEMLRSSMEYKPAAIEYVEDFDVKQYKKKSPRWLQQTWLLVIRSLLHTCRNYREVLFELGVYLIPYFAMALLYHNATGRTQESIQDVVGVLVIITCEIIFTCAYAAIYFYPLQLPILRRETNEHIYSFSAYYIAEIICSVPIAILRSFVALAVTYAWVGFQRGFMLYFELSITLLITAFTANAYGLCMSGIFKSVILEISSVFDLIFICMSGIYINLDAFPYVRYISMFFFSNEALAIQFWHNVTEIECSPKFKGHCLKNGTEVLESFSYATSMSSLPWDYFGLFVLAVIMHVLAYFGIRRIIRSDGYY